ncbi:MAG: RIP metalloprotease RseP [Acidobacteriota bacterium]
MELLHSLGWTLVSFVFVLGIMIFVHELGHFLAARRLGIAVEVFSLGFGPRIWGFRRGETDYRISALPLGGYVKMKGEHYDEVLSGSPDEFLSRPKWHRFLVAVAGPVMNLLLAVVLLAGLYVAGVEMPRFLFEAPVVGFVAPESPAEEGGLLPGDRIVAIDGRAVATWEQLQLAVASLADETVAVRVQREGEEFERLVQLRENEATGAGFLGAYPPSWCYVSRVEPESPAAAAGLQEGDVIVAVSDGERRVEYYSEVLELIAASPGKALQMQVRRGDGFVDVTVVPGETDGKGRIGVAIAPTAATEVVEVQFGIFEALVRAFWRNYELTRLTLRIVGRLVTGKTSLKMMSGPIEIARFSGQAAAQGTVALVGFMSLISLQLGIFNLLPIPILDGGIIALLLVEALLGRELSLKARERITQVGFFFLLLLMSLVILNDIAKLL